MDKNTIIGLLLIVAVMFGYGYYNSNNNPKQHDLPSATQKNVVESNKKTDVLQMAEKRCDSTKLFADNAICADTLAKSSLGNITLRNKNLTVDIAYRGGLISEVRLNNYRSYDDFHANRNTPLLLYSKRYAQMDLILPLQEGPFNVNDYVFTPVDVKDSTSVTMQLMARDSSFFAIKYELMPGDNYMLNVEIVTGGIQKHLAVNSSNSIVINWKQRIQQYEKGEYFENQYSTLTYKLHGDDTKKLSEHNADKETAEGLVDWIAFKNQYFSSVLIAPKNEFKDVSLESKELQNEPGFLKDYEASMELPLSAENKNQTSLQLYFGPNSFNLLKSMDKYKTGEKDYDLEDLVYLGWPLFKWINRFFTIYVFDFLTSLGLPMGIVLLLITILLRVLVYVPTKKSFISSAKMRVLRPKIDELNKKYPNKNDAMKKQQETMTLYSQYGVSPMGGCLPALIQMPIWIAMFNFVPNAIELRQQGFLWADDLSTYDSIIDFGTNIWGIGDHLSLFCLLFCGTNFIYSYMTIRQQRESMSGEQAQQMKAMQWMMYLMPVMFFFMFNRYSAGLNYYYFISLLASSLTMWYLRKRTDDAKLLEKLEANYRANKNDPNKKPRGLAARFESMQKMAEQMNAERNNTSSKH